MPNTPEQQLRTSRLESVIGLVAPALDLVLSAGERLSSIVAPREPDDYLAIRPPGEKLELGSIRATREPVAGDPPVE